ncbi:MAG TPA: amidohydrolase family protein [Bryobacteraceae bacterium]|nr:amidohydrolase family protein [Bryobacteraceae bacterium]
MPPSHILIRGARQLITLRGSKLPRRGPELKELNIIPDGALLIKNGLIDQVGPGRRVENLAEARDAVEISAAGRVVMPGFVDSHTHMLFPPPGCPALELQDAARAVRSGSGQRIQVKAQAHLQSMARHGTTTVEAKTGCGLDESAEMKLLRVLEALKNDPLYLAPTFLFRQPPRDADGARAMDWLLLEFLPKIQRRHFAQFADMAWEEDPSGDSFFSMYLEAARRLHLPSKIHAERMHVSRAVAMAVRHGAIAVDHLEQATAADAAVLANSETLATLLPCAGFCNGGSNAPARTLIDAGVAVALGSDFNPHHTPTLNMQTVVALACLRLGMTPAEAVSAATINGAHALGRADRVGSLEAGKSADLVLLNCSDYRDLTQCFGMNLVHTTMKSGQFIYREGKVEPQPAQEFSHMPLWD